MTDNKIVKYIDKVLSNLNKHLKGESLISNSREKSKLELRIEVFEEIKNAFEWTTSSEENKQSHRILRLETLRNQDVDVTDYLKEINLYSKIRETVPYIQAVSYVINNEDKHLTEDLLNFCEKQLSIIDSKQYKRVISFPPKEEIEEAFESYTERIKPNKIPSLKIYDQPEVNEKIEELYQMFMQLATD